MQICQKKIYTHPQIPAVTYLSNFEKKKQKQKNYINYHIIKFINCNAIKFLTYRLAFGNLYFDNIAVNTTAERSNLGLL